MELSQTPYASGGSKRSNPLEHEVLSRQVAEVFRYAGTAAAFSYFGALLTFGVLVDTGDLRRGAIWFLYATVITCMRFAVVFAYKRRDRASAGVVAPNDRRLVDA